MNFMATDLRQMNSDQILVNMNFKLMTFAELIEIERLQDLHSNKDTTTRNVSIQSFVENRGDLSQNIII